MLLACEVIEVYSNQRLTAVLNTAPTTLKTIFDICSPKKTQPSLNPKYQTHICKTELQYSLLNYHIL